MTRAREIASQGGLVLITSATVGTAVSSITVTSAFSAAYDNYRVIYSGGDASASGEFNLSLGGITSGYSSSLIYAVTSTPFATSYNTTSQWHFAGSHVSGACESVFEVYNPFANKQKMYNSSTKLTSARGASNGFCTSTASATAFTLTPASGTLTGGTIKVYGYK